MEIGFEKSTLIMVRVRVHTLRGWTWPREARTRDLETKFEAAKKLGAYRREAAASIIVQIEIEGLMMKNRSEERFGIRVRVFEETSKRRRV